MHDASGVVVTQPLAVGGEGTTTTEADLEGTNNASFVRRLHFRGRFRVELAKLLVEGTKLLATALEGRAHLGKLTRDIKVVEHGPAVESGAPNVEHGPAKRPYQFGAFASGRLKLRQREFVRRVHEVE